jgi:membrane protein YqaA with SNARE-associated domain
VTYVALFIAGLVAATLLPAQSEGLLAYHITQTPMAVWGLVAAASAGNILGSMINWWIGRALLRFQDRRWFPASPRALARAGAAYHTYGRYSLLLSWVPIIGDPLTVIAGVLREPFWSFTLMVTIAKTGRYVVLAVGVLSLI